MEKGNTGPNRADVTRNPETLTILGENRTNSVVMIKKGVMRLAYELFSIIKLSLKPSRNH